MSNSRIGIVDWGIGGIGVLRSLRDVSNVPVIYFSDTGVTPYGRMSRTELARRLDVVFDHLQQQGATHILVGCNAASTALPFTGQRTLPIEGVIDSAVAAALKYRPADLGVIGGARTIRSGIYRRMLGDRGINTRQRIAQPLSALIESGDTSSTTLAAECRRILQPLKNCSHILLACTHYPAIIGLLRQCVSARTVLIDPAQELADKVGKLGLTGDGPDVYLTTGDPAQMKRSAVAAFGWHIASARTVNF